MSATDTAPFNLWPSVPALTLGKRFLAAGLSALVPGSGQFLVGKSRQGSVFGVLFLSLLFCFLPLRLLQSYWNLIWIIWLHIILVFLSVFRAFYVKGGAARSRPSAAWGILVLAIALVGFSIMLPVELIGSGFRAFQVPSSAMRETLIPGDRILVDCWHYRQTPPTRGDLVVFKSDALLLVKRVIATGGDTIESRNGVIVVNGMRIDEPYVQHTGNPTPEMQTFGPLKVAPNKVFVMGDNRDGSFDSRLTGAYDVSAVVAKPLYIYGFDRARRGKVLQ